MKTRADFEDFGVHLCSPNSYDGPAHLPMVTHKKINKSKVEKRRSSWPPGIPSNVGFANRPCFHLATPQFVEYMHGECFPKVVTIVNIPANSRSLFSACSSYSFLRCWRPGSCTRKVVNVEKPRTDSGMIEKVQPYYLEAKVSNTLGWKQFRFMW